ncbi:MAG: hypothetical protein U0L37_06950 [Bacteroidales bacterium]|nr:hypothetical protein [Bacteroidales bacterium]
MENIENQNQFIENDNDQENKDKRFGQFAILICISILIIVILSIIMLNQKDKPHREKMKRLSDSIAKVEAIKEEEKVKEEKLKNDSIINVSEKLFTKKYDEFKNIYWIKPKNSPKYVNMNGCYCYFQMNQDSTVSNFRFVFQYFAADWLFIDRMIFNIDGENTTIIPDMNTDHDGNIWEWCDVSVDKYSSTNESFILKLANAKSVKVKLIGDNNYYKIKTLSEQQIKSIKETYNYYKALGGEF